MLGLLPASCKGDQGLPTQQRSEAARQRGRVLFIEQCAFCHGGDADGKGPRHFALSGSAQDFTSAAWRRRTTPREVFTAIRQGVPGTSMPSWAFLEYTQIWDLTAYLLSVSEGAP